MPSRQAMIPYWAVICQASAEDFCIASAVIFFHKKFDKRQGHIDHIGHKGEDLANLLQSFSSKLL